jgi:hypothetical protein
VTRVGITGHSDLTAASVPLVAGALRTALAGHAGAGLVGVSCLAPGTDQLFARAVLELGGRLEVILPAADYRDRKIPPAGWASFDELVCAANEVRVLEFERSSREAYMAASVALLARVECVVAVWDGYPSQRHGGTGDVVAAARRLGLPMSIIWPRGASRVSASPPAGTAAPEHPASRVPTRATPGAPTRRWLRVGATCRPGPAPTE